MSKDSLIKGTLILALAAFVARLLGVIQRVPLKHLLDDAGMATYGIAYNIYFPLLIIATAGIPSALSKLISERTSLGHEEEANRIFKAAVWFALGAGIIMTVILYVGAPYYANNISQDPDSAFAIRALAPALLLFPLIAILRGYFQGLQMMMPGGSSQIVEQILRVITAVGLAYFILQLGYSRRLAIAGASFGGVMGSVGAFMVMLYYWRKLKKEKLPVQPTQAKSSERLSYRKIYSIIFRISIPISLISLAVPMINFIDSSIVIPLLKGQLGTAGARDALGILTGRAQSLAGIPIILAIALSASILPIISAAYARRDMPEVNNKTSQTLRISVLSGLPMVVALTVAARPMNGLLFEDTEGTLTIALLTIASMFQIMMMTSGAILMGLGQMKAPTIHVFIGVAIKFGFSFLLAPWFGIHGIIGATMLCFIITMHLNLTLLRRTVHYEVLGKRWPGFFTATLIMMAAGLGMDLLVRLYLHPGPPVVNYLLQSICVGVIAILLYPLLLYVFRIVTAQDIQALPTPVRRRLSKLIR